MRIGSRWQLGSSEECISWIRGWLVSASEWWVMVIGTDVEIASEIKHEVSVQLYQDIKALISCSE